MMLKVLLTFRGPFKVLFCARPVKSPSPLLNQLSSLPPVLRTLFVAMGQRPPRRYIRDLGLSVQLPSTPFLFFSGVLLDGGRRQAPMLTALSLPYLPEGTSCTRLFFNISIRAQVGSSVTR